MTAFSVDDGAPAPAAETPVRKARPTLYAWYVAVALTLTYVLSMMDRKLPFIMAESIKRDLKLDDTQLGLLTGMAFTLVYAVSAIPIAGLADRRSRKWIIGIAVAVWSLMTSLGGFAGNFLQLAAARSGVAIGESASSPAAMSLLTDYFPPNFRARAIGLYMAGAQLGVLIGLPLGGVMNDLSSWRIAMFLIGAPGLLLALLVVTTVREPKRKSAATKAVDVGGPPVTSTLGGGLAALFARPTYRHLFVGGMLHNTANAGILSFGPAYVIRTFHLTASQTGLTYGVTIGVAGVLGAAFGGVAADWLRVRGAGRPLIAFAIALVIGVPCLIGALLTKDYNTFLALSAIPTFVGMCYAGPSFSTIHAIVPAHHRALATAVFLLALNGIGLSAGALITGMISDHFSALGSSGSLRVALIIMSLPGLWGALHYTIAAFKVKADLAFGDAD